MQKLSLLKFAFVIFSVYFCSKKHIPLVTVNIQQNFCMYHNRRILPFLLLAISCMVALSQPICKIRTFGTENGLPASVVSGITQSTDNLLWITTWNGLSCYDGYRFTTFRNIPGHDSHLTTNHLISVMPALKGNLWTTAYSDDVYMFDSHKCQYINVSAMIIKKFGCKFSLRKIYPLNNGDTWMVGKYNDHYCIKNGDAENTNNLLQYNLPGTLNKVVLSGKDNEWLLTDQGAFLSVAGGNPSKISSMWVDFVEEMCGMQWLVTINGKILRKPYGKAKAVDVHLHSMVGKVNDVKRVGKYVLALATDSGVLLYNVKNRDEKLVSVQWPSNPQKAVEAIYVDSKHRLWCFNDGSDITMIDKNCNVHHLASATAGSMLTFADKPIFHEDARHTVWVASKNGSFSYYSELDDCLVSQSLSSSSVVGNVIPRVKKGYSDHQGNLWLIYPHNLSLVSFSYSDVMHIDLGTKRDTRSVLQDHKGNIILGTVDGDIAKYSPSGKLLGYLAPSGAWGNRKERFSNHIYSLYEDKKYRLWIGTKGDGLFCVENGKVFRFKHDDSNSYTLISDEVYDIKEDSHGRLLVATFNGGLNISSSSIYSESALADVKFLHGKNELKGYASDIYNKVRRIETVPGGIVILSTTQGLLTYSDNYTYPDRIRFFLSRRTKSENSLYSSEVMQTLRTKDGTVYVVTLGGGLQKIASGNLLQDNLKFEDIDNNAHNNVMQPYGYGTMQSLVADNNGDVWVMGEGRLACISKRGLKEFGADEIGGVNITEALPSHSSETNRIVIATEGGAISFLPQQMNRSSYAPNIVFTSVRYMDRDDEQPILNIPELKIDVDHRSFTLFFSALDYSSHTATSALNETCSIRYAYRIDDGEWTYLHPGSNSVSFNHFPAGTHVVSVKSTNGDGVWIENNRQLTIYAEPSFLESWWGRTIVSLLLISFIAWGLRSYMKRRAAEIADEATEKADAGKVRYMLRKPEIVDEDKVFMDTLLAYIEENIDKAELKVDDMAVALSMGRSTFYSRLKQIADMSPNDFLRHVRMKRAEDLVNSSTMTFSQIAYAVGFSDPKYFGKCFKKHTGMSPSEYRKHFQTVNSTENCVDEY